MLDIIIFVAEKIILGYYFNNYEIKNAIGRQQS